MSSRILVVAPSWIGDTVLAQPLFRRLHELNPGLCLEVLAPAGSAPLLARMPEVTQWLENPFGHGALRLGARRALGVSLRERRYDQAIVLPNSFKSALVPYFARIPRRTGYVGEMRRWLLNDARPLDTQAAPLLVERYAHLAEPAAATSARALPAPRLQASAVSRRALLARLGLPLGDRVVCLCPGAEYGPAKRWPPEYFADLAAALHMDGFSVWLLGSAKERDLGDEIAAASDRAAVNLCGRTSLAEAIDLLSGACMVVCNDSGLMHVAAALGRPLVVLYGSSSPAYTPPLSANASILNLQLKCSPCFKRECPLTHLNCLRQIKPAQVHRLVMQKHRAPSPA